MSNSAAEAVAEQAQTTGFLTMPRAAANRTGTHRAGGFLELVDFLKVKRVPRPEWLNEVLPVYEQVQALKQAKQPVPDELKAPHDKVKQWKANHVAAIRAPGANADNSRQPKSYASAWDALIVDMDGVPPAVEIDGAEVATMDAIAAVLERLGVQGVIYETLTHSERVTKLRVMVHSVPLAIAADGKGYEPTRGGDERYNATVLLEQILAGGLGAVECTFAMHNHTRCTYVLSTGEPLTFDRSTYKAAQPVFTTCTDAAWRVMNGVPATMATLEAAAEGYGFPTVTGDATTDVSTAVTTPSAEVDPFDLNYVTAERITAQTVADLRNVLEDPRITTLAGEREIWIKVISALCGSVAQASEYAAELEAIAIKWGDNAPEYAGETAEKIEKERHNFTRSNPASLFTLAKSYGVPNPATVRAEERRNNLAVLGGIRARNLHPWEVERLERINERYGHALVGGKAVIVYTDERNLGGNKVHEVRYARGNELVNLMQHEDAIYGYRVKTDKAGNEVKEPCAPLLPIAAWQCWKGHALYMGGVDFYPNPAQCPSDVFNLWKGWSVTPEAATADDVAPWLELVRNAICDGNEAHAHYFISYLAHMVQRPEVKPTFAIVLRGKAGGGKGSVLNPIKQMGGNAFAHVQGLSKVAGKFNGVIAGKLTVFVDEARQSGKEAADALKTLISETSITVEKKGIDPEPVSNYARVFLASNHQDAVFVMENERRFFYLDVSDRYVVNLHPEAQAFWNKYHAWLKDNGAGKLLHFLSKYDITGFDPFKAPVTEALEAETPKTLPEVEAWMLAELVKPMPFGIRAYRDAWDCLDVGDVNCFAEPTDTQPLTQGAVQSAIAHQLCADWINENVNKYTAVRVQAHTIDKRVNKLMQSIFGISKKRQAGGGKVIFQFADLNFARCQFAHAIGINALHQFPEIDYPGMEEAHERFTEWLEQQKAGNAVQ